MKSSTLIPLLTTLLPLTSAWSITWNDPSGTDHTRTGHGPSACIPIDNPKGHLFRIDAQGETGINMLLFTNGDCEGDAAGMATDVFSKDASKDLLGFRVVRLESATAPGTGGNSTATSTGGMTGTGTGTTTKAHSSHVTTTDGSSSAGASSSSAASTTTTTQTSVQVTSAAATTTSSAAGGASSSSSSAASASTSNAAVRVAGSRADVAKGLVGGIGMLGLVVVPMMI